MKLVDLIVKTIRWMWANTDSITKWIQILALAVAAYWTYTRFLSGEKPSLETRVNISTSLKDEKPGPAPGTCYVYLDVQLQNQGTVSFDATGARIRAWRSSLPLPPAPRTIQYLNPKDFERGQQLIDNSDPDLLKMHFSPGESAGRTYTWVFRAQPRGIYLFKVDIETSNGAEHKHITTQTWSQNLCTSN
jgi:hypothetical protein